MARTQNTDRADGAGSATTSASSRAGKSKAARSKTKTKAKAPAKSTPKRKSKAGSNGKPGPLTARTADKYVLYLASVQEPDHEVSFFRRAYRNAYGKDVEPTVLREDFCGTAAVCYAWAKKRKTHRAIGVDIDPEPLDWGRANLADRISEDARSRVTLIQGDARDVIEDKADVLAAQNFSFWCFKTRAELLTYFKAAYANLAPRGVMVLDMMGGPESMTENEKETRKVEVDGQKFRYVWEQDRIDPITHDCRFHIWFKFNDGTKLKRAFTYEWRFWTLPEVRELLAEAGFSRADVYWEGTDSDGEGNGEYRIRKNVANDPSWVAYIAAVK